MRVRFAPSPTGALHIGGARTALYNWLLARGHGRHARAADRRYRPRALHAGERRADPRRAALAEPRLGRGPDLPVRALRAPRRGAGAAAGSGHAYHSTATAEDVRAFKDEHGSDRGFRGEAGGRGRGAPAGSRRRRDDRRRRDPRRDPVPQRQPGRPGDRPRRRLAALQLRRRGRRPRRRDHPRRPRRGPPLQHPQAAARVRGAGRRRPRYAHLPLLHGPDGRKLSKRHGAASVQELRDAGYLPEAVDNYIALLGAGFGADEEHFTLAELAERFRLERVSKNPAVFDERKLRHMNGRHLRELGIDELTAPAGGVHRPHRAARRGRDLRREDPDAGRLLAAGRVPVRRAGRRSGGV